MDKPLRQFAFDEPQRATIRAALLQYMREHKIGVPTLRARISQATGRIRNSPSGDDPYLVDQKTLQRFLAGVMRTNDAFVAICNEFVQTLPPVRDDFADTALSLAAFFAAPEMPSAARADDAPAAFSAANPAGPNSTIYVDRTDPTRPYVRIRECIFPPVSPPGSYSASAISVHPYEGFLLARERFYLAILRSSLTRLPRIHWLAQRPDGQFQSVCQYELFPHTPASPVASENLAFERIMAQNG
jgi:hypothetical protein